MIYRNLRFALSSAWQSFWRNLAVSMAAVLSITLILILAGVNLIVGHAFSQVLDGFRMKVSEISVNVADGTPLQSVYDFQQQLSSDPRVTNVKFMTKSESLAQFKADPNNKSTLKHLKCSPRYNLKLNKQNPTKPIQNPPPNKSNKPKKKSIFNLTC